MPCSAQEGKTLILKFGQNAYWLGRVDLFVSTTAPASASASAASSAGAPAAKRKVNCTFEWSYQANRRFAPDPAILSLLAAYLPPTSPSSSLVPAADRVLTQLLTPLDSRTSVRVLSSLSCAL
jgi:hypothetical protein